MPLVGISTVIFILSHHDKESTNSVNNDLIISGKNIFHYFFHFLSLHILEVPSLLSKLKIPTCFRTVREDKQMARKVQTL